MTVQMMERCHIVNILIFDQDSKKIYQVLEYLSIFWFMTSSRVIIAASNNGKQWYIAVDNKKHHFAHPAWRE